MPLKLNVGASKKVGEANYGSRGASVNLEMELDSALANDPPKLKERIRQLFGLVRASLAKELNGDGNGNHPNSEKPADQHHGNGSSARNNQPRPATQSQVKAIYAIARGQHLDVQQLLRDRFNVGRADDLTIKEASQLIDSLKSSRSPEAG